jgi:hypothetical protein
VGTVCLLQLVDELCAVGRWTVSSIV